MGSSFCLRIIAFLAIRQILQSSVERSADLGQQLFGLFVGGGGGADADVHATDLVDLVVLDFRGIIPNSFDGRGNYAMGLKEQLIFPEIEYDKVDAIRGMDVCICTTAKTDEEAKELLTMVGAPFYA